MNQQYVLLRKENDLLKSLIGRSFNQKSKFEAQKLLEEIHSKAESRMIGKNALCYVVENNEILGLGGSTMMKDKNGKIVSNLILNAFGVLLNGLFDPQRAVNREVNVIDTLNQSEVLRFYTSITANFVRQQGTQLGTLLQVGAGTTSPARSNFIIETVFGTSPESSPFGISPTPTYNSSLGNITRTGSIVAGGNGTINESVMQVQWINSAGIQKIFLLFRDSISPGVPFVVAQTIALEYKVQL